MIKSKVIKNSNMIKDFFNENLSFKIVSLFVALILWISILGRRDFVTTKEVEVQFLTANGFMASNQSVERVKYKISGPQPLMKKFKEKNIMLTIDATENNAGIYEFDINPTSIDIPHELRVLNIKPNSIRVEITEKK